MGDSSPLKAASELRIGLTMSGGIALVLYESGVTHEVYRFLKAWSGEGSQGYFEAFQKIPVRPVVDILTGASAGGINSVLMAHCIATGRDFADFRDLWVEKAGVNWLRYGRENPKSLLNPSPLSEMIRERMTQGVAKAPETYQMNVPELYVRLCRTHLKGHFLKTQDARSRSIVVHTKADVINFGTQDFTCWAGERKKPVTEVDQDVDRAVRAALATSAFPLAFPPVPDEGKWYVDGGLWNNQPLDLAVQVVKDKAAFLRTHRCILFVEPNPAVMTEAPVPEEEPSMTQTLFSIPFMGLKGDIWPALDRILDYNQRSDLYRSLLQDEEARVCALKLGEHQFRQSREQLEVALQFRLSVHRVQGFSEFRVQLKFSVHQFRTLTRSGERFEVTVRQMRLLIGSTVWEEAVSATDQRLEVPTLLNRVRLHNLLFDGNPALIQRWDTLLLNLGFVPYETEKSSLAARVAFLSALAALESIGEYDLERRAVRRRLDDLNAELTWTDEALKPLISQARAEPIDSLIAQKIEGRPIEGRTEEEKPVTGREEIAPWKALLYARIEQINRYLYAGDGRSDSLSTRSRFKEKSEEMLDTIETLLARAADVGLQEEARDLAIPVLIHWMLEIDDLVKETGQPEPLEEEHLTDRSLSALRLFYLREEAGPPQEERERLRITLEMMRQRDAFSGPEPIDIARHILAAVSDLSGKKHIDLIRVSPNDTDNLHLIPEKLRLTEGTAAVKKLAGEGMGHLVGFLEERWRRNDYIWGRLDSCEILLSALRQYGAREGWTIDDTVYEDLLAGLQTEILREEAEAYNKAGHYEAPSQDKVGGFRSDSPDKERQETNALLIGFGYETVKDAREPDFTGNLNYLTQTAIRLAKGDSDKPPAALDRLSRIARISSYVMRLLAILLPWQQRTQQNLWPLAGILLIALALVWGVGKWGVNQAASYVTIALYILIAAVFLVAFGAGLGYRFRWLLLIMFLLGVGARELGRYQQILPLLDRPQGIILIGCFFCLMVIAVDILFRWTGAALRWAETKLIPALQRRSRRGKG